MSDVKRQRIEGGGVHVSVEPQLAASIMEYDGNGQELYR